MSASQSNKLEIARAPKPNRPLHAGPKASSLGNISPQPILSQEELGVDSEGKTEGSCVQTVSWRSR